MVHFVHHCTLKHALTWGTGQIRNAENQQHQLLHWQTKVQCIMLSVDVRKGEEGRVWLNADICGQEEG